MQQVVEPAPSAEAALDHSNAQLLKWDAADHGTLHTRVVACIDRSNMDVRVVAHAQAVARRLHADLILAQVLEPASHADGPQDPVTWGIKRHRCRERFDWLASEQPFEIVPEEVLLEGKAAEELSACATDKDAAFLAFATHADTRVRGSGLGSTAQRLVEMAPASLLLVPPTASATPCYDRILVPLDGSCRAESVLPTVVALAKTDAADVVVVHAVPQPQFTQVGPLEPEAVTLRDCIIQRNERVAHHYLERVLRYLQSSGVKARSIIVEGDAREQVQRVALDERADLIVLAAHGQSGRADMACGSVTSYLAGHGTSAMLILRNDEERGAGDAFQLQQEYCSVPFRQ